MIATEADVLVKLRGLRGLLSRCSVAETTRSRRVSRSACAASSRSHSAISSFTLAVTDSAVTMVPTGSILFVVRGMILAHSFPAAIATVPVTITRT